MVRDGLHMQCPTARLESRWKRSTSKYKSNWVWKDRPLKLRRTAAETRVFLRNSQFGRWFVQSSWTCFSIGKRPGFSILLETDGGFSPVCELYQYSRWTLQMGLTTGLKDKAPNSPPVVSIHPPWNSHKFALFLCVFLYVVACSCITTQVPNSSGGFGFPPPKKNRENQT